MSGHYIGAFNVVIRFRSPVQVRAMMERKSQEGPHLPPDFCTKCGDAIISACQQCKTPIELKSPAHRRPAYCSGCGKPFPWTETAILAAKDYTDQIEGVSTEDKTTLKESFTDLTKGTAKTPLAASTFTNLVKRIAPPAMDGLMKILAPVMTDWVKKHIRAVISGRLK
jgi:hypothetical protein